jgi:hypothetical protein
MMRFLRRRRTSADEPAPASEKGVESVDAGADATARAEAFWRRWDALLPEVSSALGDGEPHRVDHQLAEAVAAVHPNLHFSIERGEQAIYALVVSSQADPELRVYTDAWKAAAPTSDSLWEYHDAVPPVPDPTQVTVNLRGEQYPLADVRVAPQVDSAEGLVDVAVYHPGFAGMEDAAKAALTFLPLDATLGERLAADRIGRVETAEIEPQGAIGLLEFRDLVREFDDGATAEDADTTNGESGPNGDSHQRD